MSLDASGGQGSPPGPVPDPLAATASAFLSVALNLLDRGLWPVPLHALGEPMRTRRDPHRVSKGKEPIGHDWGKTRKTPDQLRFYLTRRQPPAGLGMKLGCKGGVIDIEIDASEVVPRDVAEAAYASLFGGELPRTRGWSSRRGGHHLFVYDERLARYCLARKSTKLTHADLPGLEIRIGDVPGLDRQIQSAIPPTLNEDGTSRVWNDVDEIAPLPDAFFATMDRLFLAPPEPAASPPPASAPVPAAPKRDGSERMSLEDRARKYLAALPEAIEGQEGHKRLYHVACVLIDDYGFTREQAFPLFAEWNQARAIPPESEAQLRHKLDDAIRAHPSPSRRLADAVLLPGRVGSARHPSQRPPTSNGVHPPDVPAGSPPAVPPDVPATIVHPPRDFSNFRLVPAQEPDGREVRQPLRVEEIVAQLLPLAGPWPKRVGKTLFLHGDDDRPVFLDNADQLLAWCDRLTQVDWAKGGRYVTQGRLYQHLRLTAEAFDVIETLPHWPPMHRAYYMHRHLPEPADKLAGFLDFFTPFTAVDRELIRALVLTLFWGGLPGGRPLFLVTGPDDDGEQGRGLGKSTLLHLIAECLADGFIDVVPSDKVADIKTRLLSDDAVGRRMALIDNVKALRLSWGELEGLVTSPVISGRALYRGEGRRPNTLTWCITLNGPSLSKDLSQRTVIVKVGRPVYSGTWKRDIRAYAAAHRGAILAEIGAILASPAEPIPATRWAEWEQDVLARCGAPVACQEIIARRQADVDDDDDEQGLLRDHFYRRISMLRTCYGARFDPDRTVLFIPSRVAASWLREATGYKGITAQASAEIRRIGVKELKKSDDDGRAGWRWRGKDTDPNDHAAPYDWDDYSAASADTHHHSNADAGADAF